MIDRRQPRAFQQKPLSGNNPGLPSVSPALVEWLETEFPLTLSPQQHPNNVVWDQAQQNGRQQVIERLRTLSSSQE